MLSFQICLTKPFPSLQSPAYVMGVYAHALTLMQNYSHIKGVMNSACCLEACTKISMTKLPIKLVTISFALILSSIINFLFPTLTLALSVACCQNLSISFNHNPWDKGAA